MHVFNASLGSPFYDQGPYLAPSDESDILLTLGGVWFMRVLVYCTVYILMLWLKCIIRQVCKMWLDGHCLDCKGHYAVLLDLRENCNQ